MLDPGPNPAPERDPEPECIPVPVLLRQKVTIPAIPVPQNIIKAMEKTKQKIYCPAVTLWLPDIYYYHFQFLHDSIAGLSLSTISLLEMIPNSKQGKRKSMYVR
jgi:hypothetical protein